jgi:hypothetical protein
LAGTRKQHDAQVGRDDQMMPWHRDPDFRSENDAQTLPLDNAPSDEAYSHNIRHLSTPAENLTVPPIENLTDRRGDEPQVVAPS